MRSPERPGTVANGPRPSSFGAHEFPYRSKLLSSLRALILLWDSPALQGEILAKSGQTVDQPAHAALRHLLAWGPTRPSALAEVLGTGSSNVSKIVGRLEDDGLVARATDEADRRATVIRLTAHGERAARDVYALGDRVIAEVLETWTLTDVRRYTALTQRFVADAITSAARMRERGLKRERLPSAVRWPMSAVDATAGVEPATLPGMSRSPGPPGSPRGVSTINETSRPKPHVTDRFPP